MPNIKLISSDGDTFDQDLEGILTCSMTIKYMLDNLGSEEEGEEIPLLKVNTPILEKVIVWANHHKDDPPQVDDEKQRLNTEIDSWDAGFLNVDNRTLLELTKAADFLDIKGLLDVTMKKVANSIKGKTPEEIRSAFSDLNN